MRVFVAGATGAVGRGLVPTLVAAGHEVTGMTRTPAKAPAIEQAGATPVVADAFDAAAVARAVAEAEPEVVVNQLTDLTTLGSNMRRFDSYFETTNRLRTEGNDHLLSAARAAGARRFLAQSFGGWPFARDGAPVKAEDAPLDPHPAKGMRSIHAAIRHLEDAVTGADGIEGLVLRYGFFYGPGTSIATQPLGDQVAAVRKRQLPVIGDGAGIWTFTHIEDAAAATALAVEGGAPGLYNVVDDDPAPVAEWLPALADAVGAPAPRHVPRLLGRIVGGEAAVAMMCEVRGADNAKAKRELGWNPIWPTWREGFRRGMEAQARVA
jgi:nucleoside-diphosphate-sugar epimerase